MRTPTVDQMRAILDAIDRAAGSIVYVHCWGGHGRTGTVAGCYLVRHGQDTRQSLAADYRRTGAR